MMQRLVLLAVLVPLVLSCTDPRDKGESCSSGSRAIRFYYDSRIGRCQAFSYLGCGGNGNRFESLAQCNEQCSSGGKAVDSAHNTGNDTLVNACSLTTGAVLSEPAKACRANSECQSNWSCTSGICCPTKEFICCLDAASGAEKTEFKHTGRYAWIDSLKNCIRFSYFGQGGNLNNFPTYKDCVDFCRR